MVVVEVRRQIGCTFEFRDAAKAILRASKGLQQGWKSFASRRFSIPPTFPKRSREIQHKCIRGDFRIARTMLQSKNYDALVLALESIEKMTKSCGAKDVVAKSVICNDCLKHLLFLLDTCNDIDRNGMEYGNSSVLPRKILGVIANSCEAIGKSDLELVLSANDNDLKTRWFLSLLLSTIQDAPSRPHDAFEAVRCLGQLLISKEVESVMVEKSAIDVISSARIAGFTCHQGLEQECNKLMLRLENVGYEED
uniref:Uncharacterized protein n=1 Tax=Pseudo-nitzschia australis TaxID=44445 RepID=A0A7S4A8X5_9STRA|mmetsp:Transcript_5030/g.11200  ORF Transcript_5030/g.11200 Transcript_5030/m.11200 type:complete len:252 (+) Transcript_5030:349-1104(+)